MTRKAIRDEPPVPLPYGSLVHELSGIIEEARRSVVRSVNSVITATYWLVGQRIVEFEQAGNPRAEYGSALIERLASDLSSRFDRGFSAQNLFQMRQFYLSYPPEKIFQTVSGEMASPPESEKLQTPSGESQTPSATDVLRSASQLFPLPWSAYVRLLSVKNKKARLFYETEALRGGWSVRQLKRQIDSQFYERTALSRNKAAMLCGGQRRTPADEVTPEEEIKDPYVLEFLGLKDEYSESALEDALIDHLEAFLLELGDDFCFIGRQRRLRIGDTWYRVDLLLFHRGLRCLVIIDLKLGELTHGDAGQMHLYLNYARENWVRKGENPPVGLILCAKKDEALARYAFEGLPNKVMAAEYRTSLPNEEALASEIERTRVLLEERGQLLPAPGERFSEKKTEDTPRAPASRKRSRQ